MKELYLVLKTGSQAHHVLEVLRQNGFNGTVISTDSLRTATEDYPEEHHFYNLRHYEKGAGSESIVCLFILSDERCEQAKAIVREQTSSFQQVRGAMYSREIDDYEGSI
ncbi:MAG: hypothetical protein II467_03750 [Bacilli bacterium]|nr:hypothetical protein [Bacilli bacterium]